MLEDLVERGLDAKRRRLFVIDGSRALRKAIEQVFGPSHPVQRCRNHKIRNVTGHLPQEEHDQVRSAQRTSDPRNKDTEHETPTTRPSTESGWLQGC